jgi:hypothetical protein
LREHRRDVEVAVVDGGGHFLDQRPRVPDAGGAPIADEAEAQLLEIRRQPGAVQVVRHDA